MIFYEKFVLCLLFENQKMKTIKYCLTLLAIFSVIENGDFGRVREFNVEVILKTFLNRNSVEQIIFAALNEFSFHSTDNYCHASKFLSFKTFFFLINKGS